MTLQMLLRASIIDKTFKNDYPKISLVVVVLIGFKEVYLKLKVTFSSFILLLKYTVTKNHKFLQTTKTSYIISQ